MKKRFNGQASYPAQRLALLIILLMCPWSISADAHPMYANASLADLDGYSSLRILGLDAASKKDVIEIPWYGQFQYPITSSPQGLGFIILAANDYDAKPSALRGKELIDASKGGYNSDSESSGAREADFEPFDFSTLQEAREGCEYNHEESGIEINISAVPNLNPDMDGRPSPVVLVMFQLSDVNYVRKIAGGSDAVWVLFDRPKDKTILSVFELDVQRGEQISYTLDRVAGARYLLIAAGFRDYEPSKSIKVYNIPIKEYWFSRGCGATKLEVQLEVLHRSLR